ncbi:MAG: hypothetical protein K2Y01_08070 [Rhabdochlamydiaceae bacterium]|nr:hypothetical protein [Rhabdochlamydiaceae bacterium]
MQALNFVVGSVVVAGGAAIGSVVGKNFMTNNVQSAADRALSGLIGQFGGAVAGGLVGVIANSAGISCVANTLAGIALGGLGFGAAGYYGVKDLVLKTDDPSLGIFTYGGGILFGAIGAVIGGLIAANSS